MRAKRKKKSESSRNQGANYSGWRGWLEVGNGDLCESLDGLLLARAPDTVGFVKVKGHAKWSDVNSGRATLADQRGNDAADVLARRGAAAHALDAGYVSRVRHA